MIELLLDSGGGKANYYDSGPGPQQLLFGDKELGFFGEVTATELFNTSDLVSQIPELGTISQVNLNSAWLKFAYKGKFLFIAKKQLFCQVSWNALYGMGLVHGSDDTGTSNNGWPTNQIRLVNKGPYTLKVRTITGDAIDPTTMTTGGATAFYDTTVRSAMWTDLLYRVSNRVVGSYPTPKWANYVESDIGVASARWDINRESITTVAGTYGLIRGGSTRVDQAYSALKSSAGSTQYWRPVLEIVPSNQLFKLQPNGLTVTGALQAASGDTYILPDGGASSSVQSLTGLSPQTSALKDIANVTFSTSSTASSVQSLTGLSPQTSALKDIANVTFSTMSIISAIQAIVPSTKQVAAGASATFVFTP